MAPTLTVTRACCVCRRVLVGERWVRSAAARKSAVLVSHTYCPECFHHALAALHPPALPSRPAALVLACG